MPPKGGKNGGKLLAGLLLGAALISIVVRARFGWEGPITDAYAWRQTQTALTAFYLVGQPLRLAYETPMMGPPWSVPMEFPIYQWMVARSSEWLGMTLVSAGRMVGLLSLVATALPLGLLARWIAGSGISAVAAAVIFLSSSFYCFWGRAFMIETTALLFGVTFLAAFARALSGSLGWAWVATVCGTLAGLAKITTFGLFLAAAALLWLVQHLPDWRARFGKSGLWQAGRPGWPEVRLVLGVLGVPVMAAALWVLVSDRIKLANPISATLASQATAAWNFGSWEQRLDGVTWKLIAGRTLDAAGGRIGPLAFLVGACVVVFWTGRFRRALTACVGLFALGPLVFTNLYLVHDYYYCANLIFLLGAIWLGVAALLASSRRSARAAGWLMLTGWTAWQLHDYQVRYVPLLRANPDSENASFLRMAERIRRATPPGRSVIWITDQKPAPVVAFYSERRTLILTPGPATPSTLQVVRSMARENVAVVANSSGDRSTERWILAALSESGLQPSVLGADP